MEKTKFIEVPGFIVLHPRTAGLVFQKDPARTCTDLRKIPKNVDVVRWITCVVLASTAFTTMKIVYATTTLFKFVIQKRGLLFQPKRATVAPKNAMRTNTAIKIATTDAVIDRDVCIPKENFRILKDVTVQDT